MNMHRPSIGTLISRLRSRLDRVNRLIERARTLIARRRDRGPSLLTMAAVLAVLSAGGLQAQTPDCVSFFTFASTGGPLPAPGATPTIDNRQTGCVNWIMVYESSGFTGLSLTFQSANGATAPGTLGPFSGTVLSGTNPATNTTLATTTFNGYVGWFNVALSGLTGTGTVRGSLYGYRAGYPPPASGPPCPGTVTTPCVVIGPDAPAVAPTQNPVQVSGFDGTDVRRINTDATGRIINDPLGAATAQADGTTNTPNVPEANGAATQQPVYPFLFNGLTWDREFYSTNQVQITLTGTAQKLVAQVAAKKTRLTHISFAMSASADASIVQGTTTTTPCDTSQVVLAGPYKNITALALDFGNVSPLADTAVNLDTCLIFSGSVTAGGVALYANF